MSSVQFWFLHTLVTIPEYADTGFDALVAGSSQDALGPQAAAAFASSWHDVLAGIGLGPGIAGMGLPGCLTLALAVATGIQVATFVGSALTAACARDHVFWLHVPSVCATSSLW